MSFIRCVLIVLPLLFSDLYHIHCRLIVCVAGVYAMFLVRSKNFAGPAPYLTTLFIALGDSSREAYVFSVSSDLQFRSDVFSIPSVCTV